MAEMADNEKLRKKVSWCLDKAKGAKKGEKHRGILKIKPDAEESDRHIGKALHNLKVMEFLKSEYPDWSMSAAFYAMYHAVLSVLYALGYESRNQECSITFLEYAAAKGMIKLEPEYIELIRSTGRSNNDAGADDDDVASAKSLREDYQYGTETVVKDMLLNKMHGNAYRFVEKLRIIREQLRQSEPKD